MCEVVFCCVAKTDQAHKIINSPVSVLIPAVIVCLSALIYILYESV